MKLEDVTLDNVKHGKFGCCHCLWYSVECVNSNLFQPRIVTIGRKSYPSCTSYCYYD